MLGIVIVDYKGAEKTVRYVKQELSKISIPFKLVVVNVAAEESTNRILQEGLGGCFVDCADAPVDQEASIFILADRENLGYAKGNNLGAEFLSKHFDIDYFLITNNDLKFVHSDVVEQLIKKIDQLGDTALIGPRVLGIDGTNQNPLRYDSIWSTYIWMYWITPFVSLKQKIKIFHLDYHETAEEGHQYAVMGAFFLAKARHYIECGMMDPNTFLYSEEKILAERLSNINKKTYYYPAVEVIHEHNVTISQHIKKNNNTRLMHRSRCYYYKEYIGVSPIGICLSKISLEIYLMLTTIFQCCGRRRGVAQR